MLAPDALSAVAYAPDEILIMLGAGGLAALAAGPWVGLGIAALMAVVVASYRQTIKAYPRGGDYQVARENLGPLAGVATGGAMMVDALLTVAVSITAGVGYLVAIWPSVERYRVEVSIVLVLVMTLVALRGSKSIGPVVIGAVYAFLLVLAVAGLVGLIRFFAGALEPVAVSQAAAEAAVATNADAADLAQPPGGAEAALTGLAWAGLVLRAFAAGAVALTGVQAISQATGIFREPKARNAARSLSFLGLACGGLLLAVLVMAKHLELLATAEKSPVLAQIFSAIYAPVGFLAALSTLVVAMLLAVAASTAFRWVPNLMSLLAHDAYLPKQFYRRGDRRVAAHGILTLGVGSALLIWLFDASLTRLIQLYIVGVFTSFTLSGLGMIRHWNGQMRLVKTTQDRRKIVLSRLVNGIGLGATSITLAVVVVTKFTHGAWVSLLLLGLAVVLMGRVHAHYQRLEEELAPPRDDPSVNALPSRVHAIVLVSAVSKSTARAIAYARATRPSTLEALTVRLDHARLAKLRRDWDKAGLPVPLRVMDAPSQELTRPVIEHIKEIRRHSPRDLVVLYIPEKIVGHWWEKWLHNRSAARLATRLRRLPGVVIASVPWQLESVRRRGGLD